MSATYLDGQIGILSKALRYLSSRKVHSHRNHRGTVGVLAVDDALFGSLHHPTWPIMWR